MKRIISNETRTTRMTVKTQNPILAAILIFYAGCSVIGSNQPLEILSHTPETNGLLAADGAIVIRFDEYIDPNRIDKSKVSLTSGDLSVGIKVGYDVVERALLVGGYYPLRAGIVYVLKIEAGAVQSLTGDKVVSDFELSVRTRVPDDTERLGSNDVSIDDAQRVFEASCGCHGPEPKAFPALRMHDLVNQPSFRQPEFDLVVPGKPLDSYLVLRLLEDYPGIRGSRKKLSPDDTRLIIDWIQSLAAR